MIENVLKDYFKNVNFVVAVSLTSVFSAILVKIREGIVVLEKNETKKKWNLLSELYQRYKVQLYLKL